MIFWQRIRYAFLVRRKAAVKSQKCVNKRLSFLKAEKNGEGEEEEEGSEKRTDAAVVEDEDPDSESKEATVLSKVNNLVIFLMVYSMYDNCCFSTNSGSEINNAFMSY